jgi:hypothetical protein
MLPLLEEYLMGNKLVPTVAIFVVIVALLGTLLWVNPYAILYALVGMALYLILHGIWMVACAITGREY